MNGFFHEVPNNDALPHNLAVGLTDEGEPDFKCHCNPEFIYNAQLKRFAVKHQSFDLREMCGDNPLLFPVITKIEFRGQRERIVAE